jgi:tape measure domain-containing protein
VAEDITPIGLALDTSRLEVGVRRATDGLRHVEQAATQAQQAVQQRFAVGADFAQAAAERLNQRLNSSIGDVQSYRKAIEQGESTLRSMGVSFDTAGQAVDRFGTVARGQTASSLQEMGRELTQARQTLQGLPAPVNDAGNSLLQFSTLAHGAQLALGALGVSFGVAGLVNFGKSILETGTRMEQLRASLNAISGGAVQGNESFRFLTDVGQRLGLNIQDLVGNFTRLSAATRGTALEGDNTKRIFEAVAIAGRAVGASNSQIQGAFLALEQMISKGTVSMEELRRQLGNAIPGAFETAARAMGMTTSQLNEFVASGEAKAIPFVLKFAEQLRKEYAGGVEQATNTAATAFQRLENEWTLLKERIAKGGPLRFVVQVTQVGMAALTGGAEEAQRIETGMLSRLGPAASLARPEELDQARRIAAQTLRAGPGQNLVAEDALRQMRVTLETRQRQAQQMQSDIQEVEGPERAREQRRVARSEDEKAITGAITETTRALEKQHALYQAAPELLGATTAQERKLALLKDENKLRSEGVEKLAGLRQAGGFDADQEKAFQEQRQALARGLAEENQLRDAQAAATKAGHQAERDAKAEARRQAQEDKQAADQRMTELRDIERTQAQEAETLHTLAAQYTATREARDADKASMLEAQLVGTQYATQAAADAQKIRDSATALAKVPQWEAEARRSKQAYDDYQKSLAFLARQEEGRSLSPEGRPITKEARAALTGHETLRPALESEDPEVRARAAREDARLQSAADPLNKYSKQMGDLVMSTFEIMASGTKGGLKKIAQTWEKGLLDMLGDALGVKQMMSDLFKSLFKDLLGAFSGGTSGGSGGSGGSGAVGLAGFVGSLFGGGKGGATEAATANAAYGVGGSTAGLGLETATVYEVAPAMPAMAEGGTAYAHTAYLMGEEGPELVIPHSTSTVLPADQTARVMRGGRDPVPAITVHVYGATDVDAFRRSTTQIKRALVQHFQHGAV